MTLVMLICNVLMVYTVLMTVLLTHQEHSPLYLTRSVSYSMYCSSRSVTVCCCSLSFELALAYQH